MADIEVRRLSLEEARTLYERRLVFDFPPEEVKPFSAIERATARGGYACYGAVEGEMILAYAFFVTLREGERRVALFDYLAVAAERRDQGVGSRFIRALLDGALRELDCVLLEIDDPASAPDPRALNVRLRRQRFYLKNGLVDTGVAATVYGADYRILALPVGPCPSPAETRRLYGALYHSIMPQWIYQKEVLIR